MIWSGTARRGDGEDRGSEVIYPVIVGVLKTHAPGYSTTLLTLVTHVTQRLLHTLITSGSMRKVIVARSC